MEIFFLERMPFQVVPEVFHHPAEGLPVNGGKNDHHGPVFFIRVSRGGPDFGAGVCILGAGHVFLDDQMGVGPARAKGGKARDSRDFHGFPVFPHPGPVPGTQGLLEPERRVFQIDLRVQGFGV